MFNPERTFSAELKELLKQPSKKLIRYTLNREDAMTFLMSSSEGRAVNANVIEEFKIFMEGKFWKVKEDSYLTIDAKTGDVQDGKMRLMAFLRSTNTEFETYIKLIHY